MSRSFRSHETLRVVWMAVWVAALSAGLCAQEVTIPSWERLSYKISKLMLSARIDVTAELRAVEELPDEWIEPSEGRGLQSRTGEILEVRLDSRGLGRASVLRLWADPDEWTAFQRWSVESGSRRKQNRYRGYRFTDIGVHSLTKFPTTAQMGRPDSEWSDVEHHFQAFPRGYESRFVDPTALFWLISQLDLDERGDRAELRVWLRRGLFVLELVAGELTHIRAEYVRVVDGVEKTVKAKVLVRRVKLKNRPLFTDAPTSEFRFAGLTGDITIDVDPRNGLPLQISGNLSPLGRGNLKLKRAIMRP